MTLNAKTAEKFSDFLLVKQNIEEDIALKNVGKNIFTNEDLLGVMDMLQFLLTENTNSNTVSLCLSFLVEICCQLSKYTTEMKINLITELKILKSLLVHDTSANTIQNKEMNQTDIKQSVLTVENFLTEELQKLSYMNTHFVQENATYNEKESNLSPSYEPIIVARKPLEWSCTNNVIKYGVWGINIDECRISFNWDKRKNQKSGNTAKAFNLNEQQREAGTGVLAGYECEANDNGRFPANTILTYWEEDKEEVCGGFPYTKSTWGSWIASQINTFKNVRMWANWKNTWANLGWLWDEWSAARYFYCAKASKRDRDEWLDKEWEKVNDGRNTPIDNPFQRWETLRKNTHPTVKPTDLMQYLVRLVTPNGWTVLDPFNWSGSTWKAVMYENKDRNKNYKYIWIELTEEYLPIAKARIEYVINKGIEKEKSDPKQEEEVKQRKESALF